MLRPLQNGEPSDRGAAAVMPVIVFDIFGTLHQVTVAAPGEPDSGIDARAAAPRAVGWRPRFWRSAAAAAQ